MSPSDVVDLARQCIDVTDAFIKLDSFLDRNKRYNSSNLDQLRVSLSLNPVSVIVMGVNFRKKMYFN
jgi:hypothetical protein